jgi:hypothetical protein
MPLLILIFLTPVLIVLLGKILQLINGENSVETRSVGGEMGRSVDSEMCSN